MDFNPSIYNNMTTTLLVFFSIFFILLKICKKPKAANGIQDQKLPPSPPKLPLIGHLHHLGTVPFRSFKTMAETYGDFMSLKLGEVTTIVISSPEIAGDVLKTLDPLFANKPESIATNIMWYNGLDIAFSPYNEYWRQMRKICILELLSAKSVRSFSSIRNDEVSNLINSIRSSSGTSLNLSEAIAKMSSSITCRAAFGKVCKDRDTLIKLLKQAISLAEGFLVADLFPSSKLLNIIFSWNRVKLLMMRRRVSLILDDIINEHRNNLAQIRSRENHDSLTSTGDDQATRRLGNGEFGNEDLVDVLLRIQETGELEFPIENNNIKAIIYDMFAAGTETTSTTIDWVMAELMRNPHARAKVQAEVRQSFKEHGKITGDQNNDHVVQNLKYLKLVIKETLRLHPPVPLIPRASRDDCEINGYKIPNNTKILVNSWAIGRDHRYWTNPEAFEPERFENSSIDFTGSHFEFLPFGAGRRMCPGLTFGLANVELPLAHLLYHFNWELANGIKPTELNMIENPGLTSCRSHQLHVIATAYDPKD